VAILDGKNKIKQDKAGDRIAHELVEAGIPKQEIYAYLENRSNGSNQRQ